MRLSARLNGEKNKVPPSIVVVQDLFIDSVKVVAAGALAQYNIVRKPPRRFNMPGEIGFDVLSVAATNGELIDVRALQTARGDPPCVGAPCLDRLLFWMHGDPGHIDGGLMLIATVIESIELNRGSFPTPQATGVPPPLARLHFYQVAAAKTDSKDFWTRETPHRNTLSLDGRRTGTLEGSTYACCITNPGPHSLRIGHDNFMFDAAAGDERYIRITNTSSWPNPPLIEETKGYEFVVNSLKPASFGKNGVSCFDPLDKVLTKERKQK